MCKSREVNTSANRISQKLEGRYGFSLREWFPASETVTFEQGLYPEPGKSYAFDQSGFTGNTGETIMSEDSRDKAAALAEGMEAAGALIENLEQEVAELRSDLDEAAAALKAAQEEVSSRAEALEEKEKARVEAEGKVEDLRAEISALKQQHSDEQLRLSNEHINEIAEVRRKLEEQRRNDEDAASSGTRVDTIKEEFRREREALEARYREEVEALKNASEHWEEQLRTSYQEQEARHAAELEAARSAAAERESALERSLSEDFERRLAEERSTSDDRQTAAVQALRSAAAERELELQNVVRTQQEEIETLRDELEAARRSSEERRKEDLRRIKALAEGRENDLKKTHATRLAEAKESADKRIAAIQAQREADNRALRARHEEETARLRREHEERLAVEDERRKSETWALDERLREATLQRETEMRAYMARLTELEAARLSQRSSCEEDLERVVERLGAEISISRTASPSWKGPSKNPRPAGTNWRPYSAGSAPAVRSRPLSLRAPTMPWTKKRKGLWRMSKYRTYWPRRRSKTWRRNSLRPEKRVGVTPKSCKEPWKASTGSPTRHAGSGKA